MMRCMLQIYRIMHNRMKILLSWINKNIIGLQGRMLRFPS